MLNSGFTNITNNNLSDNYTDITLLHASENGYSEVYKAKRFGKWHILKTIKQSEKQNIRFAGLLEKEFEIAYNIQHPNIVITYSICNIPELGICIDQEYIDGEPLDKLLTNKRLNKKQCYNILIELCSALSYIHSIGITHRDIKPENIIITNNGHHVKLIDFGLADTADYESFSGPAGTMNFASPEQLRNIKIDNRSDIFSIGALIDVLPYSDSKLKRISKKCTDVLPQKRYDSADEIISLLQHQSHIKSVLFSIVTVVILVLLTILSVSYKKLSQTHNDLAIKNAAIQFTNDSLKSVIAAKNREQALLDSLMVLTLNYAKHNIEQNGVTNSLLTRGEYPKKLIAENFSKDNTRYNEYIVILCYAEEEFYTNYSRKLYQQQSN